MLKKGPALAQAAKSPHIKGQPLELIHEAENIPLSRPGSDGLPPGPPGLLRGPASQCG